MLLQNGFHDYCHRISTVSAAPWALTFCPNEIATTMYSRSCWEPPSILFNAPTRAARGESQRKQPDGGTKRPLGGEAETDPHRCVCAAAPRSSRSCLNQRSAAGFPVNPGFAVRSRRGQASPLLRSFAGALRKAAQQVQCPAEVSIADRGPRLSSVGSVSGTLAPSATVPSGRSVPSLNSCFPVSCDLSCSVVLILTPRKPPQAAVLALRFTQERPTETRSEQACNAIQVSQGCEGVASKPRITVSQKRIQP